MSIIDVSLDEFYRAAITEQLAELEQDLNQLRASSDAKTLTKFEYLALERTLQLLVEVAIGISKRVLKSQGLAVPTEARKSLERLKQEGLDSSNIDWRGAIGMRNALVHDYLDIDEEIVLEVLTSGKYEAVLAFCRQYLK